MKRIGCEIRLLYDIYDIRLIDEFVLCYPKLYIRKVYEFKDIQGSVGVAIVWKSLHTIRSYLSSFIEREPSRNDDFQVSSNCGQLELEIETEIETDFIPD